MKSERRTQLASDALARELEGFPGLLRRWGNTALTAFLAAAAIYMLIRWRLAANEANLAQVLNDLASARVRVEELRSPDLVYRSVDYLAGLRQNARAAADDSVKNVLNNSSDNSLKAQAQVVRGDLYWQLANFPELPGATTRPALASPEPADALLKKSADAYDEVLKNDGYAKQTDAVISAHFGLAAIAENRGDWESAKQHFTAVTNEPGAPTALVSLAKRNLDGLVSIQTPLYVAPTTQAAAIDAAPFLSPLLPKSLATSNPVNVTTQPDH